MMGGLSFRVVDFKEMTGDFSQFRPEMSSSLHRLDLFLVFSGQGRPFSMSASKI